MPRSVKRSEASIQRSVVEYARSRGFLAIKQGGGGARGSAGWPDYLFITPNGCVFFFEFKREGGQLTALQASRMKELWGRGVAVHVVSSVLDGKDEIEAQELAEATFRRTR
jgi:hypothetical protein